MSKHLVSRVPRARQQIPRLDGPVFPSSQDRRDLSFSGGGPVRPSTCPGKGKLGGETRLPMVRKTMEWVSIKTLLIVASCQHQGRLGQDLVKAFVHNMRA